VNGESEINENTFLSFLKKAKSGEREHGERIRKAHNCGVC